MTRPGNIITGVLLQALALMLFVCMDSLFKQLAQRYPVPQLAWARFFFSSISVWLFFAVATRGRIPWRSRRPGLQAARSLTLAGCTFFFASGLVFLPLADATAVNFATPVLSVMAAAIFLRERVALLRWIGVGLGLVGVMLAIRPPFLTGGPLNPAYLLPLTAAVLNAAYQIMTAKLAAIDNPRTTILHTSLAAAAAYSLALPFVWTPPAAGDLALMAMLGLLGGAGHGVLVLAYARAPASLLAPTSYSQLLWAGLAGWLLFADLPDHWTIAGAGVIFLGGVVALLPGRKATRD